MVCFSTEYIHGVVFVFHVLILFSLNVSNLVCIIMPFENLLIIKLIQVYNSYSFQSIFNMLQGLRLIIYSHIVCWTVLLD